MSASGGLLLQAALAYAARGWPVLPLHWILQVRPQLCSCHNPRCASPGKHPLTSHGLHDATLDPEVLRGWWARWPNAHVGGRTGNRWAVIDVDVKNHAPGDETLAALQATYGQLPRGPRSLTPSGGEHLHYHTDGHLKSGANTLGDGVDTRGTGGYVVLPPSQGYRWDLGADLDVPLPDLPLWVYRTANGTQAAPSSAPKANGSHANGVGMQLIEGSRNDALASIAGAMRRKGVERGAILAALTVTNRDQCVPPLDADEVEKIAWSIGRYVPDGRRTPAPPVSRETSAIARIGAARIGEALPPLEYLVRGIGLVGGAGAPHLLAGYGFSGKTVCAQALLLSLASERPLWGVHTVERPVRVLHLDYEQGERLTRRRYQRLAAEMGLELAALEGRLELVVSPPISLIEAHRSQWRDLMGGQACLLVDSLRASAPGQDENSSAIRCGLDMLGSLSEETGCRSLVISHSKKMGPDDAGGRYAIRGSSAIFDAVDSAYLLTAAKGEPVAVEHVKARSHGEPVDDFALVISDVESNGDPKAQLSVRVHGIELVQERRDSRLRQQRDAALGARSLMLRELIQNRPGLGSRALRDLSSLSGANFAQALERLGDTIEVRAVTSDANGGGRPTIGHFVR